MLYGLGYTLLDMGYDICISIQQCISQSIQHLLLRYCTVYDVCHVVNVMYLICIALSFGGHQRFEEAKM